MKAHILILIVVAAIIASSIFMLYKPTLTSLGITLKVEKVNYGQPMNFTVFFKKTPANGILLYRVWIDNQMMEEWKPLNFQEGDRLTLSFNYTGPIANPPEIIFDRGGYKKGIVFVLIEGKEFNY